MIRQTRTAARRLLGRAAMGALAAAAMGAVAAAAELDGVWEARGYGEVLDISAGQAVVYDINPVACVRRPGTKSAKDLLPEAQPSADGRLMSARSTEALTLIHYRRLAAVPEACARPSAGDARDPLYNFDVFWSWFDQNYAFFLERGVDWNQVRAAWRPRVTAKTSDAELLDIFRGMLRTLQDRHTSVSGEGFYANVATTALFNQWLDAFQKDHPDLKGLEGTLMAQPRAYLRRSWDRYLDPGSLREVSDLLAVGSAAGGRVGYVQVLAEAGYSDTEDGDIELAAADKALRPLFAGLEGRRGLILDLRFNYGGDDRIALLLAGLLTDRDRPGFSKCTRDGAGFTPAQQTWVRRQPEAFTGPIVILSSPDNVSSGENLVMIARSFPNVVLVGDRSASVHSDVLHKTLPNGWKVGVSNEAFVAPDGSMYETTGVPPDVLVPYAPEEVRQSGVDPLMEKALDLLASRDFETLARGVKRGRLGRPSPCPQPSKEASR